MIFVITGLQTALPSNEPHAMAQTPFWDSFDVIADNSRQDYKKFRRISSCLRAFYNANRQKYQNNEFKSGMNCF